MKKSRLNVIILFGAVFLLSSQVEAIPLDKAYREIGFAYPFRRQVGGSFSLFFGGLAATRGTLLITDSNSRTDETIAGYFLIGMGLTRAIDGTSRLLHPSSGEQAAEAFANIENPDTEVWVTRLRESRNIERVKRQVRASMLLSVGLTYLYLYQRDTRRHSSLIYSGIALSALGTFRLLRPTPEEKAWQRFEESDETEVTFIPMGNHLIFSVRW